MRIWQHRRYRARVILLAVIIVAGVLLLARYGILYAGRLIGERWPVNTGEVLVRSETRLTWVTHYSGCGDEDVVTTPASPDQVGLTRAELAATENDWTISAFGRDGVTFERSLGFCDLHRLNRFLILEGDTLVIHRGKDESGPIEKQIPDFAVEGLGTEDRLQLQRGQAFSAADEQTLSDEIEAYLEGIIE
jgi:hypothetical protein